MEVATDCEGCGTQMNLLGYFETKVKCKVLVICVKDEVSVTAVDELSAYNVSITFLLTDLCIRIMCMLKEQLHCVRWS